MPIEKSPFIRAFASLRGIIELYLSLYELMALIHVEKNERYTMISQKCQSIEFGFSHFMYIYLKARAGERWRQKKPCSCNKLITF